LKNRTLTPVVQLFMKFAHNVAKAVAALTIARVN
jgi:hypothetical protein